VLLTPHGIQGAAKKLLQHKNCEIYTVRQIQIWATWQSVHAVWMCALSSNINQCYLTLLFYINTAITLQKLAQMYTTFKEVFLYFITPSVLWHCWLGISKKTRASSSL